MYLKYQEGRLTTEEYEKLSEEDKLIYDTLVKISEDTAPFELKFDRIMTPKFSADIEKLKAYEMDIAEIMTAQVLKDINYE